MIKVTRLATVVPLAITAVMASPVAPVGGTNSNRVVEADRAALAPRLAAVVAATAVDSPRDRPATEVRSAGPTLAPDRRPPTRGLPTGHGRFDRLESNRSGPADRLRPGAVGLRSGPLDWPLRRAEIGSKAPTTAAVPEREPLKARTTNETQLWFL